jgi:alpha-mannosidase
LILISININSNQILLLERKMQIDETKNEGAVVGSLFQQLNDEKYDTVKGASIHVIPQSHIDLSWHWNDDEALEMVRLTFEGHIELLENNHGYTYAQSQLVAYEWIEEFYPDLFNRLKKLIKEGRWVIVGGQWVEAAEMIISAESLARQFLIAQHYAREKFGVTALTAWSPDDGGHEANVPQLYKLAEIKNFIFKRPREKVFTLPQIPFRWEGLDGTEMLSLRCNNKGVGLPSVSEGYQLPEGVSDLFELLKLNREKNISHILGSMGVGDTGGVNTMHDMHDFKDCKIKYSSPESYFNIVRNSENKLDTVKHEMPSLFDGSFTTHQDFKQLNRTIEDMLYDFEALKAMSLLNGNETNNVETVPIWKALLFNQFHDIAWGALTQDVDESVLLDLKHSKRTLKKMLRKQIFTIGRQSQFDDENGMTWIVFNTLPWARGGVVKTQFESGLYELGDGALGLYDLENNYLCEIVRRGEARTKQNFRSETVVVNVPEIPAMGYRIFKIKSISETQYPFQSVLNYAENQFVRVEVNPATGFISSLVDKKSGKELVADNDEIAKWQLYEEGFYRLDYGIKHNAWKLGCTGKVDTPEKASVPELVECNNVYKMIRTEHQYKNSSFKQEIFVYNDSPIIEIEVEVDWHESETLARLEFPFALNQPNLVADTKFGSLERPCDGDEFAARNWVALTEESRGVGIFNNSLYGHSCIDNTLRLSVIRSSSYPSPQSDQGVFRFRYAIMPFNGAMSENNICAGANKFFRPLFAEVIHSSIGNNPTEKSFVSWESENIVPSSIKPAENGEGIVVRSFESNGSSENWQIKMPDDYDLSVQECNVLEDENDDKVDLKDYISKMKPFMIKNLIIKNE